MRAFYCPEVLILGGMNLPDDDRNDEPKGPEHLLWRIVPVILATIGVTVATALTGWRDVLWSWTLSKISPHTLLMTAASLLMALLIVLFAAWVGYESLKRKWKKWADDRGKSLSGRVAQLESENREMTKRLEEDIRIYETIEFRRSERTGWKWLPFCPKCHIPAGRTLKHGIMLGCTANCGWASPFHASDAERLCQEVMESNSAHNAPQFRSHFQIASKF